MRESFRKIGLFLAAIIISAAIYFTFYAKEEVKQSVLEYSLDLMGEKLLALVPNGTEKNKLNALYQGFKERAIEGKVAPAQIENMAANILNTSNSETALTPQQAEGILRSAMLAPAPGSSEWSDIKIETDKPSPLASIPKPERLQFVGTRVKTIFEFNEKVHLAIKEKMAKHHEKARQIHYRVKDGLSIVMDLNLRSHIDEKEFKNIAMELESLEKEQVLKWEKDLSAELEREMAEAKSELEALQESLDELKEQKRFEVLKELESLKSLEHLKHIPVIDPDSIRKVVEKSLREAGIYDKKSQE